MVTSEWRSARPAETSFSRCVRCKRYLTAVRPLQRGFCSGLHDEEALELGGGAAAFGWYRPSDLWPVSGEPEDAGFIAKGYAIGSTRSLKIIFQTPVRWEIHTGISLIWTGGVGYLADDVLQRYEEMLYAMRSASYGMKPEHGLRLFEIAEDVAGLIDMPGKREPSAAQILVDWLCFRHFDIVALSSRDGVAIARRSL